MQWDDARDARARQLFVEGSSAGRIADLIGGGCTRADVICRVAEKQWRRGPVQIAAAMREVVAAAPPVPPAPPPRTAAPAAKPPATNPLVCTAVVDLPPEPIDDAAVPLVKLLAHHCRWPKGEPVMFCGRRRREKEIIEFGRLVMKFNGPYCPTHASIAYAGYGSRAAAADEMAAATAARLRGKARAARERAASQEP